MADNQIEAIVRAIDGFTSKVTQKVTLDVTANLIETTPVDTGWARANWVPSVGKVFAGPGGKPDRPTREALVVGAEGQQQSSIAGIASYDIKQGSVFVSNNVGYIEDLNSGTSSKAPAAFVQSAIDKAVTKDIAKL